MPYHPLETHADLQRAIEESFRGPVLLFKHSATCPISAAAQSAMNQISAEAAPPVYRLVVQQSRALSNDVARQLGVRHESPQAIVLVDGAVAAHTSHFKVTAAWVRDHLSPG